MLDGESINLPSNISDTLNNGIHNNLSQNINSSFSIIFEDKVEGYKTEEIGCTSAFGFSNEELFEIQKLFPSRSQLINLKEMLPPILHDFPDVYILLIKNPFENEANELLSVCTSPENSVDENITGITWDSYHVKKRKNGDIKIVPAKDKHRILFNDLSTQYKRNCLPQYDLCSIYNVCRIPALMRIKNYLDSFLRFSSIVEGYSYFDLTETYTPFHRDRDRRKMILMRLGRSFPINFKWFHGTIACSVPFSFNLDHGDLLIMSDSVNGYGKEGLTKLYLKYSEGFHINSLK